MTVHVRPELCAAQQAELCLAPNVLAELLDGHLELVQAHLGEGRPLLGASGAGGKVLGVGITRRESDGSPALLVQVDSLEGAPPPPATNRQGVPLVHQAVGAIGISAASASPRDRVRPVPGGVSIAPAGMSYAGSLACIVEVKGQRHILGNAHNLANLDALPIGAPILQPAAQDGGGSRDLIAKLSYFALLNFEGTSVADAALAAVVPGVEVDPRILRADGSRAALTAPIVAPAVQLPVRKSGRTTGDTSGEIQAIGMTIRVALTNGRETTFVNMFATRSADNQRFAQAGDTGALITTQQANQPVGLLVATSSGLGTAYATPMSPVLDSLSAVAGAPVTIVYA